MDYMNDVYVFHGRNKEKAWKVFYDDIMKRHNKISKMFDTVLEEKEMFERGE